MSTTNPPLNHFPTLSFPPKFNTHFRPHLSASKHRSSPSSFLLSSDFLCGLKKNVSRKSKGGLMGGKVIKVPALGPRDDDDENNNVGVIEQEALLNGSSQVRSNFVSTDFEATLNRLSKWLVAGLFGAVILYRHDAEGLWAGMGSILNSGLSVVLKRILNQERPIANLRSDPGMPSSHVQSIFYAVVFIVLSMVEWQGVNEVTLIFGAAALAFGSYLSWLRVSQQLHTISQVAVGAVLGSCFLLLWLWSWDGIVLDAFNSYLWVKVSILLGCAICGLAFLSYVVRNWFTYER